MNESGAQATQQHDLGVCFFAFDGLLQEETAIPEECPLFFFPPSLPCLDLAGYVSAMVVFAEVCFLF